MLDFCKSLIGSTFWEVTKRLHYALGCMLTCMRWYLAYPLSLRYIDEMMQALGVFVGYAKVHRCSIKVLPVMEAIFRRNHTVCRSWFMDDT